MGALQASFESIRARPAPGKLLRTFFFRFLNHVVHRIVFGFRTVQFKQCLLEVKNVGVQRRVRTGIHADCRVEGAKREGDFEA